MPRRPDAHRLPSLCELKAKQLQVKISLDEVRLRQAEYNTPSVIFPHYTPIAADQGGLCRNKPKPDFMTPVLPKFVREIDPGFDPKADPELTAILTRTQALLAKN